MASSLFQNNPQTITKPDPIKEMMEAFRNSSNPNPNQLLQTLISQNPQVQQVMQYANQFNGDYRTAFYNLASSRGIDPNQIINYLKN